MIACVPITRSTSPAAISCSKAARWAVVNPPVTAARRTWLAASIRSNVRACCRASTSVGAISAAWYPCATASSMAYTATTVLPLPTSPCNSRFIGIGPAMSAAISAIAFSWPAVSSNGNSRRIRASIFAVASSDGARRRSCCCCRRTANANCKMKSS